MEINELNKNAMGGTELMQNRLHSSVPADLLEKFQIIPTRVRELDPNKFRILWVHDLPNDPETFNALGNGKWDRFHKIVFVSNHQMQQCIAAYHIPWSRCCVIANAITPIEDHNKDTDKVNFIYHTTPHRGLNILVSVFDKLAEEFDNIHLDVYSSFEIYGWRERDQEFKDLFEYCDKHEKITNHGTVSNDEIRSALQKSHIFAFPSIWTETSCLSLIEAMSAKNICIHPNLGALYETAANMTVMYQFHEDINHHAGIIYNICKQIIPSIHNDNVKAGLITQKNYAKLS